MIKAGIDHISFWEPLIKNKKIGVITNQTGVNYCLDSTPDILAKKTIITALFAPEHGLLGNLQAGEHLNSTIDPKRGCPVYSLYGTTKKPTLEMLNDVEVLVFDIQDVGVRYYTYLYTMAYAMESAKEKGIPFIVFDRPNPLSGLNAEGTILNTNFRSFVGRYPIIQRYGLTIGELARLFNETYDINCDLTVVPMLNWKRNMFMEDTKLPFVMPSPNIPSVDTAFLYTATCLFEGTNLSEGRGTTKPFHLIGAPWFKSDLVINALKKYSLQGVMFKETFFTPMFSKHEKTLCQGIEIFITDRKTFLGVKTGFILFNIIRSLHEEFTINPPYKAGMPPMLDLLVGDDFLSKQNLSLSQVLDKIIQDTLVFNAMKERFHLYE